MSDRLKGASGFMTQVGYPLLLMSAVLLQLFTAFTAYGMVKDEAWRFAAAVAAFALPPLSDLVVAYYARQATGSWINAYSVWLLAWLLLFLPLVGFGVLRDRKRG